MNRFVRLVGLVAVFLGLAIVDLNARGDWTVLENCHLMNNPANDGDSVHVSVGSKEYVFRLYLVDAPEIEATNPARLVEQAQYFEITVPQAIEVGEAAKAFTHEKLAEPFTVFTRMSDAMGRSKIARVYAFVETKEGDLGEQLVRNGLARIHGVKIVAPGFANSEQERQKLEQLEDEAKKEKIGGWGINSDRLKLRAQKPNSVFTVFADPNKATTSATPVASPSARAPISEKSASSRPSSKKVVTGKLDINTATESDLKTLPGIGPAMAARIIAARPFKSADDLHNVKGIGDKNYEKLRPYFN